MKTRQLIYFIIGFIVMTILTASAQQNPIQELESALSDSTKSPSAVIMQSRFEFEPVVDGTEVVHDFVILNKGSAPLSIRDVITNCGCAIPTYPKEILPGNEGKIIITFNTTGYGGMTSDRKILVSTNDPQKSVFYLNMSGKIEAFAKLDPKIIVLRGSSKDKIQTIVTITPDEKYPFTFLKTEIDDD